MSQSMSKTKKCSEPVLLSSNGIQQYVCLGLNSLSVLYHIRPGLSSACSSQWPAIGLPELTHDRNLSDYVADPMVHCCRSNGSLMQIQWFIGADPMVQYCRSNGSLLQIQWFIVSDRMVHCCRSTGTKLQSNGSLLQLVMYNYNSSHRVLWLRLVLCLF
jgi:hypothetical protein